MIKHICDRCCYFKLLYFKNGDKFKFYSHYCDKHDKMLSRFGGCENFIEADQEKLDLPKHVYKEPIIYFD